jgi:hypothetical protein
MKNLIFWRIFGVLGIILYFTGCGGAKIVIPTYSAPHEYKKIAEIESGGDTKDGSYLTLAINPDIEGSMGLDKKVIKSALISSVKQALTETNFITIYPIYDTASVALSMKVLSYEYKKVDANTIKANIQVSYTITKGVTEYISKTYGAKKNRHAASSAKLPSKNEIIIALCKDATEYFIDDISPRITNQLREFKSMPSELEYITTYAKLGNYEEAVNDMNSYKGAKDRNFYYNLAILYEALGSKTGDLKTFKNTEIAYAKSMKLGGHSDETIVKSKARFDNFYRLFKMTQKQKQKNKKLENELNDMYGQVE